MALIAWLNGNAGFMTAVLTAVYVGATLWIVVESRRMNRIQTRLLEHSETLERARQRPYIIFSIDFERVQKRRETAIYVYARVRNVGATSAHDVVVKTSPALRGRLGVDGNKRASAIVDSTIAFMPPGHELKDIVSYAPFLFEDHKDEELCFSVDIVYGDGRGERYQEQYRIDVAAQKEAMDIQDEEKLILLTLTEHTERISRSLEAIARTLDSPDRSLLMNSSLSIPRLSAEQMALLRELTAAVEQSTSKLFFAAQYMGDDHATIRTVRDSEDTDRKSKEVKGFIEDIEYLCRTGALHGYYRHGSLQFSLTPHAEAILRNYESNMKLG